MLDLTSEFGMRTARRLNEEQVIWLTTVKPDGTPEPNPVWFLWVNETFLIFSQPAAYKVRNIQKNPRVSLHFNTDSEGENVSVFIGRAVIDTSPTPASQVKEYMSKYKAGIESLKYTPETMLKDYSVVIRVTPIHLRGF